VTDDAARHLVLNLVREEHALAFEDFLRSVVTPAISQHAPHQVGRWQVLREDPPGTPVVTFAFLFSGGSLAEWELFPVLEAAYGEAEARGHLSRLEAMVTGEQQVRTFRALSL
jgi:hypothetical protein